MDNLYILNRNARTSIINAIMRRVGTSFGRENDTIFSYNELRDLVEEITDEATYFLIKQLKK